MKTEYEAKILDININEIKEKLSTLGAKYIGESLMRRHVYDFTPADENSWIRLRDNGKKTTLTIKEIHNHNIDGTKEAEVAVDDFETTNLILNKLGYVAKAYQENKRESYTLEGVEIEIDHWPKIPPYLEIEGDSVESVSKVVELLGFKIEDTTSISTQNVYKKYGLILSEIKDLKFD